MIKKNIFEREALKHDLAILRAKKPDYEPVLGEGEQRRQSLIQALEKAMREVKNKGAECCPSDELFLA